MLPFVENAQHENSVGAERMLAQSAARMTQYENQRVACFLTGKQSCVSNQTLFAKLSGFVEADLSLPQASSFNSDSPAGCATFRMTSTAIYPIEWINDDGSWSLRHFHRREYAGSPL
jgi:hypothetical protein